MVTLSEENVRAIPSGGISPYLVPELPQALLAAEVVVPSIDAGANGGVLRDVGFTTGILHHLALQFPLPSSTFDSPRPRWGYPPLDEVVEEDEQTQKDEKSHGIQPLTKEVL